jgi:hypothetical protein
MKQYFYSDGIEKYGPFTIEELKSHHIKGDTLMWSEGMDDWKPANQISSISMLFDLSGPPPAPTSAAPFRNRIDDDDMENERPMPKNYLVESILVTLFCCLPLGIVGIVNAAKVESNYRNYGYKEAKIASDEALKWVKWSLWVGVIGIALYLIAVVAIGVSGGF